MASRYSAQKLWAISHQAVANLSPTLLIWRYEKHHTCLNSCCCCLHKWFLHMSSSSSGASLRQSQSNRASSTCTCEASGNNKGRNQNSGFKMGTGGARQSVKATKGSTHQIATGRCCDLECEWQRHTEILQRVDREVTAPTFKSVHVCACVYLGTSINYTSTHTDTHRYMHTYICMSKQYVCMHMNLHICIYHFCTGYTWVGICWHSWM